MRRILAHKIIWRGAEHRLAVAEIGDNGRLAAISPYERETPATVFINGAILLSERPDGTIQIIPQS